jgi:hypothetical protein
MRRVLRPACAPAVLLFVGSLFLSGCGGVREDRTITFSSAGNQVGFQHGREGVFVADKEGGGLTKIFTPDKDMIAVSTPLWAPNDRRLIFTTARVPGNANTSAVLPGTEEDPAGRVFFQQPGVYTCWLRDEPKGDAAPEPRELFTVAVDDVGYVAAGLAVRWHPKGDRVLYVQQVNGGQAVFEFDLAARESRRVFPDTEGPGAVVFDWTPDGSRLVCLLADAPERGRDGIWIGGNGADWWHVVESAPLAVPVGLPLSRLQGSRPSWTADGQRFAFVTAQLGKEADDPVRHLLWTGSLEGHRVRQEREEKEPIRDLVWRPDGQHLGFLTGGETGALRVTNFKDDPVTVAPARVRSFAGWDAAGKQLAYTTVDDTPLRDEAGLSLLLFADPLARDTLRVAATDGKGEARTVTSGLRTTFARWSPKDEKLTQWFTFCPTYRSIFSRGLDWGLPRGDPAAVLDAANAKIAWLAVDGTEKAQIGHYYLLKRDYAEAWRWYEQAERERDGAAAEPAQTAPGRRRPFRDPSLFTYYCLEKLGRRADAAVRLDAFRKRAPDLLPPEDPRTRANVRQDVRRLAPLARDFYAAEVFLSLDAAEDGEVFFRRALVEARTDDDRFSAAVVLSQLLLLRGRADDYALLATETIAPLLLRSWKPQPAATGQPQTLWTMQPLPVVVGALSLCPLGRRDFLAKLSPDRLKELAAQWAALREKAPDHLSRLGADVVLEGLYRRLGRDRDAEEVRKWINSNPRFGGQSLTEDALKKRYEELRGTLEYRGLALVFELRGGS